MSKLFSSLTLFGLLLASFFALSWNAIPANAQSTAPCGTRGQPPCPTAKPPPPPPLSRPEMVFGESAPFLPPAPVISPTNTVIVLAPPPTNTPVPPTSTNTPVPPTLTSTPKPTLTPTPTVTPFPSTIVLNELLPKAKSVDWNNDGVQNADDEWVEIYNGGSSSANLGGWKLDSGDKTVGFTLPLSTTIASRGFLVFYRGQTQLVLDSANALRLLYPDGSVADAIQYTLLDDDRVHARAVDGNGAWRLGCVPTPGTANCKAEANVTTSFDMPYFRETIASPTAPINPSVIATNIFLAIILALAMGFFGNLLNDAIESHEEHVARLLGPVTAMTKRVRQVGGVFDNWMSASRLAWLGFIIKLAVILVIYGTVLAYLDPSFSFVNQDGWMLIIALGLSTGLIGLVDDITSYVILRWRGGNGIIRMHSGNFLVVLFSTLFSRVTGIVPGLILGSPAGIEEVTDPGVGKYLDLLAILSTVVVTFAAWFVAPMFGADAWFNTVFLLIFAAGVQITFFEMMPLNYLHGKGIFRLNRLVWLILFAFTAAVFLQTMLNPNGAFISAFNSPNIVILSIIVTVFCVFCAGVWFYLQQLDKRTVAE